VITTYNRAPRFNLSCRVTIARFLIVSLLAGACPPAIAQIVEDAPEFELKAAFIYNFGKFIEWPAAAFPETSSPFPVCVMGKDPFGESLLALQKRTYNGRPIVINYPKTVAEARDCRILYVDDPGRTPLGRDVGKALGTAPVLTVSSSNDAIEAGIGIRFVQQSGKVRWEMNLDATRRAQLKVSAKLIEISVAVVDEARR
jgi:hypothetical protein